jgi:hypothetical protein
VEKPPQFSVGVEPKYKKKKKKKGLGFGGGWTTPQNQNWRGCEDKYQSSMIDVAEESSIADDVADLLECVGEYQPKPQPERLCFKTPVSAMARSKRTRTGGRVWSFGSP